MAVARDMSGGSEHIVALAGDAAFTNGISYEALNNIAAQTKRLIWRGLSTSFEQALPDEARTVSELSGTADAREGLAAVIERRDPSFQGR